MCKVLILLRNGLMKRVKLFLNYGIMIIVMPMEIWQEPDRV